jgi:hypothetical protein
LASEVMIKLAASSWKWVGIHLGISLGLWDSPSLWASRRWQECAEAQMEPTMQLLLHRVMEGQSGVGGLYADL